MSSDTYGHPWGAWVAMVGDRGFETLTREHYAWIDYVSRHDECDHPAIDCNGRILMVSCEHCQAALDDFAAVPSTKR